ncbi:ras GTPase-activating-like protein IQGAP3 isoform X1 [Python bivittatus]|uniref:Ras GTPase-activating-like protein IQGAP3 isoform X1 n=2 Tax=Python bivittatus TaxID=176946 RepID=A0A9F2RBQ0_PYTBI|nr:ras GTPase-activating-like protein IQGAP3 isoform X1 [Python bivittatus]
MPSLGMEGENQQKEFQLRTSWSVVLGMKFFLVSTDERLTAEEMDERRHQNIAYQYLCHLEEAKRWIEACLKEPLPPPTELEESLRNGVTLAKLGHFFAPDVCPLGKIYDLDQARFQACGLHFRHTDNINRWRDAMSRVGLPVIFHPETTDIYDKKNMPRVVYCIHALSLYLFKRGLAPQIQDLYGKVDFTDEEINHMKGELEKYGLQLPSFSKIGGILAKELSVDEAAVHAAILAINNAIDVGVVAETVAALCNPSAMLAGLQESLGASYQEELFRAKVEKAQNTKNQHLQKTPDGEDIYDRCLTQAEIQGSIHLVNIRSALEAVDDALDAEDPQTLYHVLQDPVLALRNLRRDNARWYLDQLNADREEKALELGYVDLLEQGEIQAGLHVANQRGDQERAAAYAMSHINASLRRGIAEETLRALANPEAQLPEVFSFAAELYQRELSALQRQHPQGELAQEELFVAVEMLSAVALVNQALEDGDSSSFWRSLLSSCLGLSGVEEGHAQRYFESLSKQKCLFRDTRRDFLSWNDIQASVNDVNALVREEGEKILAVRLINEALLGACPERTLTALLLPSAGLCDVMLPRAKRYHFVLVQMLRQKAQVTGDAGALLWWEEIQEGVCRANQDGEAALQMALGVAAINQAIREGNAAQTVRVLRNPHVGLCGVVVECAAAYQAQLCAVAAARKPAGDSKAPWVRHRLKDGTEYYFSLRSFEGSWEQPKPLALRTAHLSREEIQAAIARVTSAHDRERLWGSNVRLVIRLQARMRGFLVRRKWAARRRFLSQQVPAAVKIQASWRGYLQRRRYLERLRHLRRNTAAVIKIQSWVRMWRARKRYLERLRYFRENVAAVVKIQAFVRANKAREDYRMLVHSRSPPISIVRRFAHLLEQSQRDYEEELELLALQENVVRGIRSNQQLESDLNLMDIKIGLLVKNRITLQEVASHCRKLTKKNKEELSSMMDWSKENGLKALSKEKRKALEAYQHLFYHLQTRPVYLARLIMQMPPNKSTKFMESVVFSLYSYASSARDAYLLLQLFRCALQEEIASKVTQLREILTGNPTVIRMVVSFYRNARGQNALRQILGEPVQEVLQNRNLSIRMSPVEIYRGWINEMESQSGQKSNLPYNVTPEQALGHPEVQRRLDTSLGHLLVLADKFLSAILSSVDKIPYGMRYMAKVLKTTLTEKFPDASKEEVYKVVGTLLYYRFMNPAVVAPDGFDVVDLSAGAPLHPDQRRNLASVAKILQHAAANQLFEGENRHLNVVNQYLEETHQKFRAFISAACSVPEPEERFNVDEYSEMVAITKPVVYITVGELVNTHKLLLEHQRALAPDPQDVLHKLLQDLGEVPTVPSLIGHSLGQGANGNWEQALSQLSRMELSLTLSGKRDGVEADAEGEDDAKGLWLSTKQMLVDVIRSQPGDSLAEILHTQASEDEERLHRRLVRSRALCAPQSQEGAWRCPPQSGSGSLSLAEKKKKIVRSLQRLEPLGWGDPAGPAQALLGEIAKDIRSRRQHRQRRRAQLARLQQASRGLGSKRRFFEEQADYYQQYLRTCLDNLAAGNRPNKKQAVLHYTAARLFEKGVLLEIEDLPSNQLRNVIFEIIPSREAGKFQVKAKFMGIDMENFQLHYQDLLQLQYEGVAIMKMFDKARINVNLLIFLLNKKFFKK